MPGAFPATTLDYYPNSTGEVTVVVGNRIVATGRYTQVTETVSLVPPAPKSVQPEPETPTKLMFTKKGSQPRYRIPPDTRRQRPLLFAMERGIYTGQEMPAERN